MHVLVAAPLEQHGGISEVVEKKFRKIYLHIFALPLLVANQKSRMFGQSIHRLRIPTTFLQVAWPGRLVAHSEVGHPPCLCNGPFHLI